MTGLETLAVPLGARSYDVIIGPGALERGAERLKPFTPRGRAFILADSAALEIHHDRLCEALSAHGIDPQIAALAGGEDVKTWDTLEAVCDGLLEAEIERGEAVIAFGGGTIGDLTGLAAAIVKRGLPFVQIPTTLLAQVDSSVGGKTAINTPQGKNLIGAFHQPSLVLADTALLESLPARELRAGYAEIVKAALIGDKPLFDRLEAQGAAAVRLDRLAPLIAAAVRFKARIVADDEREAGLRALLNLGHTFGHALEAEAEPGALLHGEAVACGLALAFRYAARLGACSVEDAGRVERHLQAVGLPASLAETPGGPFDPEGLTMRMGQDKKNTGGSITLILARAIGQAYMWKGADRGDIAAFLKGETA